LSKHFQRSTKGQWVAADLSVDHSFKGWGAALFECLARNQWEEQQASEAMIKRRNSRTMSVLHNIFQKSCEDWREDHHCPYVFPELFSLTLYRELTLIYEEYVSWAIFANFLS
jgi:hypothetical protein